MKICAGCKKRIWFWQDWVECAILPKDGKGGVFYVHFCDSCIALIRNKKMGGKQ